MTNENAFDYIRIRSLTFWAVLSFIIFIIIAVITEFEFETPLGDVTFSILFYTIPSIWIIWKFKSKDVDYKKIIGKVPAHFKWWWIVGIVALLMTFSLGAIWLQYYPISLIDPSYVNLVLNEQDFSIFTDTDSSLLYIFISILIIVIIAPIVEEFLFRGIIIHRLSLKWGTMWAVIISSILFGILHADLIGSFVFGFFMAILYIGTKTLLVPIACHILNNALAVGFLGVDFLVNGSETIETVTQFQSDIWMGVLLLLASSPFVIYYIYKNWPKKDTKMPYFS